MGQISGRHLARVEDPGLVVLFDRQFTLRHEKQGLMSARAQIVFFGMPIYYLQKLDKRQGLQTCNDTSLRWGPPGREQRVLL